VNQGEPAAAKGDDLRAAAEIQRRCQRTCCPLAGPSR
jgi:hypothetical protein